jgi:hypothetical protein
MVTVTRRSIKLKKRIINSKRRKILYWTFLRGIMRMALVSIRQSRLKMFNSLIRRLPTREKVGHRSWQKS